MMRALALIAVLGCGKGSQVASGGSRSAGSAVASTADAAPAAPAKLLFDDKESLAELRIAFDNHTPVLPALLS